MRWMIENGLRKKKKRVVEIDREGQIKGKNFSKMIKERWHRSREYLKKRRTA